MDDNLFTADKLQSFKELTSSNLYLKELSSKINLPEGYTVQTLYQTSGRGQFGNNWQAEPGQNLLFSFLLKPDFLPLRQIFTLNMSVCLALREALQLYIEGLHLKWPNDLLYRENKLAGILIENLLQGRYVSSSVIGIGINVNQTEFDSTQIPVSSLRLITGNSYGLENILQTFQTQMEAWYKELRSNPRLVKREYLQSLYGYGNWIPLQDAQESFTARIIDVLDSGELLVEKQNGEQRTYRFKEVKITF